MNIFLLSVDSFHPYIWSEIKHTKYIIWKEFESSKARILRSITTSSFSSKRWRRSISFGSRLLLESLPLAPFRPPWRMLLRIPPFPQPRISELPTRPAVAPNNSLFTSESFSPQLASALATDEGWELLLPLDLLFLFSLTSVKCSSAEDESLTRSCPSELSSSSDPWCSTTRRLLRALKFRYVPCLLTNAAAVALAGGRFLPSASDCRWKVWAIEAWICGTNPGGKTKYLAGGIWLFETQS